MSNLRHYLNKYYSNANAEDLHEHFREKFGVNVKNEGNLYQFKYNMLDAQWRFNITWECRGSILRFKDGSWEFVCRPFNKFFNQHEGYCEIFDEKDFNSQCKQLSMVEKADGTCIVVWYDDESNRFRASTLGMITTGQVGDYKGLHFDDLFFQTLRLKSEDLDSTLEKSKTYIFELCCEENRILTRYKEPSIFLLGIRDNVNGDYIDEHHQNEICQNVNEKGGNVSLPFREPFYFNNIDSLAKAKEFVHYMSEMESVFGEYPEGFVIYDGFKPVCKMKNQRYVALHHVSGGDVLHTRNVIIESFFNGNLDDIYDLLTDRMKEFADSLKDKVHALFNEISHHEKNFAREFETQKEYALEVQKYIPKPFYAFFFQNKNQITSGKSDLIELFTEWIRNNYKKHLDYWKS